MKLSRSSAASEVYKGQMHAFPRMEGDQQCDVAIVGGGISAALIAPQLSRSKFVLVATRRTRFI